MTQEPMTVESVDLQRYAGRWFEIARLPMRYEDPTASEVTADYALNDDGTVQVVNRCINEDGEWETSQGQAEAVDDTHAKLKVTFMPSGLRWIPFTDGDYWIIGLDADYQTALVGAPNRKYLWLLHRNPRMTEEAKRLWLAKAQAQGYDLSELIYTPQTQA